MTEKEVIENYYERIRQEQKQNGTYDSSKAFTNGMGVAETSTDPRNERKPEPWGGWARIIAERYNVNFDNGRR